MSWLSLGNRWIRRSLVLRGVESAVHRVEGMEIHAYRCRRAGRGPPLLMVHGLGSSANGFFRTLIPLADVFKEVWALDLPGNGFSPTPAGGQPSLPQLVELVLQFRRTVVGERAVLLGNSLGGAMALSAASEEPESFAGLVLVSPAGAKWSQAELDEVLTSFRVSTAREARALAKKMFARPPLTVMLFADELRRMVSSEAVRSVVDRVGLDDALTEAMLGRLTMPTLLLWGGRDTLLPPGSLDYFRAHLPTSAETTLVEAFGHMPQMEHPVELVRRLTDFARRRGLG